MHAFILAGFLPAVMGAALKVRQYSTNGAFNGWSAPDETYDGDRILGTFDSGNNDVNSSSPGITKTDYSSSQSGRHLNITIQNLIPSMSMAEIFVAVHSDDIALFELGKPVSQEISNFVSGSNDAFSGLRSRRIYGTGLVNNGSSDASSLAPGQYLNSSIPLSVPSDVNDEELADALDDLDASLTIIGRLSGLDMGFFAVDGSDLGDEREQTTASVYSFEAGFLTLHSGYVNGSMSFAASSVAQVLTYAG